MEIIQVFFLVLKACECTGDEKMNSEQSEKIDFSAVQLNFFTYQSAFLCSLYFMFKTKVYSS